MVRIEIMKIVSTVTVLLNAIHNPYAHNAILASNNIVKIVTHPNTRGDICFLTLAKENIM